HRSMAHRSRRPAFARHDAGAARQAITRRAFSVIATASAALGHFSASRFSPPHATGELPAPAVGLQRVVGGAGVNLQHNRIEQLCDVLTLERISSEWPAMAQQCARDDATHSDFLERLLCMENDARIERQRAALMKIATLPSVKTIEDYDFAFASGAPRAQIQELAALTFIERANNVVFLGPSGV